MAQMIQFCIDQLFMMMSGAVEFLKSIQLAEGVSLWSFLICCMIIPIVIKVVLAQVNVRGRLSSGSRAAQHKKEND